MKGLTSRTANKTRSSNSNPAIAHENRLHHARPHPHKPSLTNSTGSAHSGAITAHKLTGTVRPGSSGGNSRGFLLMPAPMEDVTERAFRALTYKYSTRSLTRHTCTRSCTHITHTTRAPYHAHEHAHAHAHTHTRHTLTHTHTPHTHAHAHAHPTNKQLPHLLILVYIIILLSQMWR